MARRPTLAPPHPCCCDRQVCLLLGAMKNQRLGLEHCQGLRVQQCQAVQGCTHFVATQALSDAPHSRSWDGKTFEEWIHSIVSRPIRFHRMLVKGLLTETYSCQSTLRNSPFPRPRQQPKPTGPILPRRILRYSEMLFISVLQVYRQTYLSACRYTCGNTYLYMSALRLCS